MGNRDFIEYASSPERTLDELYVIELLIDRVRMKFDEEWYETNQAHDEVRKLPSYRPSFSVEDLERAAVPIAKMDWLSFQRTNDKSPPLRTVAPLRFALGLRALILPNNNVRDLEPLAGLPELRKLDLRGNPVQDLSPLRHCPRLWDLTLNHEIEADWSVLQHCSFLTRLSTDAECLPKFQSVPILSSLKVCKIYCGPDREIRDFLDFPAMPELRCFNGLHMGSLEGIERFPLLEELTNVTFRVDSLQPLSALKNLTHANIHGARVDSVAPLAGLPQLRDLYLGSLKPILDEQLLGNLPLLHEVSLRTGDSNLETPVDHPNLEALRGRLTSWDTEFLSPTPRFLPSARIEVVDESIFEHYNSVEGYGVPAGLENSSWLSSEIQWLDSRIQERLGRYLTDDVDFTLPFQWMGSKSRTVYLMSLKSLRHLGRVIADIQQALAHFRSDWIIYLEAGDLDIESLEFEVWIYPDKIVATEKNVTVLRKLLSPWFFWTAWLYRLRVLR